MGYKIFASTIITYVFASTSIFSSGVIADDRANRQQCDPVCVATYFCNGLNQTFYEDKELFEIARKATNNELARFFCVWKEGLVLPGGKETWAPK